MQILHALFMILFSNCISVDAELSKISQRFLLQNKASTDNCKQDIMKSYPGDVMVMSSSELYHDDKAHDFSASRSLIDTKEETTPDGVTHEGAWSANFNNYKQFLQFEMKKNFSIQGIVTQGRNGVCCNEWVTSYRILYSDDCNHFVVQDGPNGAIMPGNQDKNTKATNMFISPIKSKKCIRIMPFKFNNHISMRVGLIGHLLHPETAGNGCALTTTNMAAGSSTSARTTLKTAPSSTTKATVTIVGNTGVGDCQSIPCLNNGICRDTGSGYKCFCSMSSDGKIFYAGKRCELALDTRTSKSGRITSPTVTIQSTTTGWIAIPGR